MDPELQNQMAAFEAARITQPVTLTPAKPARVLAVRDGSDQDATVLALATAIAARFGAEVGEWSGPAHELAHESILAAAGAADLVIAPCPFDADYAAVGRDTLSTTLDIVITRSPVPVLLARGPVEDVERCLAHPLVIVDVCADRGVDATSWAVALGTEIALLSILDPAQPLPREELVGVYLDPAELDGDDLHALAGARTAALTAALQRHAHEVGISARVKIGIGPVVDVALQVAERRGGIVCAGRPRDPASAAAAHVRSLALRCALPVLLA